jgi:hypothetical protein
LQGADNNRSDLGLIQVDGTGPERNLSVKKVGKLRSHLEKLDL